MSREFMTDWLVRRLPRKDHNEHLNALAKLPAQFVFDLLIFPLLEAQLECFVSGQTLTVQPLFASFFAHPSSSSSRSFFIAHVQSRT